MSRAMSSFVGMLVNEAMLEPVFGLTQLWIPNRAEGGLGIHNCVKLPEAQHLYSDASPA